MRALERPATSCKRELIGPCRFTHRFSRDHPLGPGARERDRPGGVRGARGVSHRTRASWQPYRKETQYPLMGLVLKRISTIAGHVAALLHQNATPGSLRGMKRTPGTASRVRWNAQVRWRRGAGERRR